MCIFQYQERKQVMYHQAERVEKLQGKEKNKIPKTYEDLDLNPNNLYSGKCMTCLQKPCTNSPVTLVLDWQLPSLGTRKTG